MTVKYSYANDLRNGILSRAAFTPESVTKKNIDIKRKSNAKLCY